MKTINESVELINRQIAMLTAEREQLLNKVRKRFYDRADLDGTFCLLDAEADSLGSLVEVKFKASGEDVGRVEVLVHLNGGSIRTFNFSRKALAASS
jgi:hypothetical protein